MCFDMQVGDSGDVSHSQTSRGFLSAKGSKLQIFGDNELLVSMLFQILNTLQKFAPKNKNL